jgi:hypothetical protein
LLGSRTKEDGAGSTGSASSSNTTEGGAEALFDDVVVTELVPR